jgi:hypothetical protein
MIIINKKDIPFQKYRERETSRKRNFLKNKKIIIT